MAEAAPLRAAAPRRCPTRSAARTRARPSPASTRSSRWGEEVHEVAVGPVHAGIIEPGHFRFQCHGEQVFHLEIVLGYQHRGIEAMLKAAPTGARSSSQESIAGDTSVGHGLAYVSALESLSAVTPPRAMALRASPSSWSGWRTTSGTSARSRTTWGSSRRRPTAGRSGRTS